MEGDEEYLVRYITHENRLTEMEKKIVTTINENNQKLEERQDVIANLNEMLGESRRKLREEETKNTKMGEELEAAKEVTRRAKMAFAMDHVLNATKDLGRDLEVAMLTQKLEEAEQEYAKQKQKNGENENHLKTEHAKAKAEAEQGQRSQKEKSNNCQIL